MGYLRRFSTLSPLVKVAITAGTIAALCAVVQLIAWLAGTDFNIVKASGGRGVLLPIAMGTMLFLMGIEGRCAADYGLVDNRGWQKRLILGFLIGLSLQAVYWTVAVGLGGATFYDLPSERRMLKAALGSMPSFPVAITQQIIFSGYLLSVFRQRYHWLTSVLAVAVLLTVLTWMSDPAGLLESDNSPKVVGMFLLGTLLASVRVLTGSIFLPAGFLAGCIFTRRFLRKTGILTTGSDPDWVGCMAAGGDSLQAPAVWLLFCLGIVVVGMLVQCRKDQPSAARAPAKVDSNLKRLFPFSNACMLAPLDIWLGRLIVARFAIGPKYLPRAIAILVFSTFNTVLSLPERLLAPLLLRRRRVADPVVIVGVHRSGTTHLHNLLALDPQFTTTRAYHALNPAGFLSMSWLVVPLLAAFLPWRRPMDGVRFHVFAPQEDEFALAGLSGMSPSWGMSFPRRWPHYDRFIHGSGFSSSELRRWQGNLLTLLRKLVFWTGKRPLLKNPYHTARVAAISEVFPRARFIHVFRHPYDVYRSNMHMAREGHVVFQLQDQPQADSYSARFLENYRAMEDAFYRDAAALPAEQVAEVRFEDLEADPIGEVRRIYGAMGLEFRPTFLARLEAYLATIADYQKNRFATLPEIERRLVDSRMAELSARWGYTLGGGQRAAKAA